MLKYKASLVLDKNVHTTDDSMSRNKFIQYKFKLLDKIPGIVYIYCICKHFRSEMLNVSDFVSGLCEHGIYSMWPVLFPPHTPNF